MGRPKQALPVTALNGLRQTPESLLRHAARAAVEAGLRPVVVVLGAAADLLAAELADLPLHAVTHSGWARGIGSSLKLGVECVTALAPSLDGVLVGVCDQPHVSAIVLQRIARTYRRSAAPVIASAYAGVAGVPALFDRSIFAELHALQDRDGARRVIGRDPERTTTVPFPLGAVDLDTPDDYAAYLAAGQGRRNA